MRWMFYLVVSFGFTISGIYHIHDGSLIKLLMGVAAAIFGIIGIIVAAVALFSERMVLRLTPEGFGFGTLKKRYFYYWSDILVFGVGDVGAKKVCFTLREHIRKDLGVREINRRAIGFDRFLPDTYGMKPMDLAKLLEDWRHRHARP